MSKYAVAYARIFVSRMNPGQHIFGFNVAIGEFASKEEAEAGGRRKAQSGEFGPSVPADRYEAKAVEIPDAQAD